MYKISKTFYTDRRTETVEYDEQYATVTEAEKAREALVVEHLKELDPEFTVSLLNDEKCYVDEDYEVDMKTGTINLPAIDIRIVYDIVALVSRPVV